MYLRILERYVLKCMNFILLISISTWISLKKTDVKLELITDINMLWMVERGIRGGIYHATHTHVKANNKYITNYDKNKESSYIQYLDANNFYG